MKIVEAALVASIGAGLAFLVGQVLPGFQHPLALGLVALGSGTTWLLRNEIRQHAPRGSSPSALPPPSWWS